MSRLNSPATGTRRPVLAAFTGLIAVSAYAGAAGLITGVMDMDATIEDRFPFGSPVLAGIALALVVAVPMTVVTRHAVHGDSRVDSAAVVAGGLLVGWTLVEIAFIRHYTWLQLTFAAAGILVLLAGIWPRVRAARG